VIRWICRISDALRDRARRRRWTPDAATGRRGEDLAHRYLERRGFTVVARNWRPPSGSGEIDLVAWDGPSLVFVEVKCRRSNEFGDPARNVGTAKRDALVRAGRDYARRTGAARDVLRVDLVSIVLGAQPEIAHSRDALPAIRTL
jgi:putative endonuclease